jgi:diguanylate cyclase (GGDEF)-like protein
MIKIDNQSVGPVTLSCGVAVFPDHGDSGDAVLQMADSALLAAKQKGRNRVEIAKL